MKNYFLAIVIALGMQVYTPTFGMAAIQDLGSALVYWNAGNAANWLSAEFGNYTATEIFQVKGLKHHFSRLNVKNIYNALFRHLLALRFGLLPKAIAEPTKTLEFFCYESGRQWLTFYEFLKSGHQLGTHFFELHDADYRRSLALPKEPCDALIEEQGGGCSMQENSFKDFIEQLPSGSITLEVLEEIHMLTVASLYFGVGYAVAYLGRALAESFRQIATSRGVHYMEKEPTKKITETTLSVTFAQFLKPLVFHHLHEGLSFFYLYDDRYIKLNELAYRTGDKFLWAQQWLVDTKEVAKRVWTGQPVKILSTNTATNHGTAGPLTSALVEDYGQNQLIVESIVQPDIEKLKKQ